MKLLLILSLAAPVGPADLARKLSEAAAARPNAALTRAKAAPNDVDPPTPFFEFYGGLPRALVDAQEEHVCGLLRDGKAVVALAREASLPTFEACGQELVVTARSDGFVVFSTR